MTKKRFIYCEEENGEFPFPYIKYDGKEVISLYECVDLLNALNDENEQLKQLCEVLKEKIQFYDDHIINPECPICHTILRKISIDYKKDRYYRKCPKCGYEREESLI